MVLNIKTNQNSSAPPTLPPPLAAETLQPGANGVPWINHGPIPAAAAALQIPAADYNIWIRTFGRLRVYVDYEEIRQKDWAYPKVLSLLRFLLLRQGTITLDKVLETIWPSLPASRARKNFSVALHHLRRTLDHQAEKPQNSSLVLYKAQKIRFDHSQVLTDRGLFLKLWDSYQARPDQPGSENLLNEMTALYAGPLYEDEPYEDWCAGERQRLADLYLLAREALARNAFLHRHYGLCVQHCQEMLAVEPLHEPGHLLLMQAYEAMGHRSRAISHFHNLRHLLDAELGVPPSGPLREVYEQLLTQ